MLLGILRTIEHTFARLMRLISIGCLITLWLLISAGVFVRFVPISSMGWADEIIEMTFAWMVFMGAAVLWREKGHFRVEVVPEKLAGTVHGKILEIILSLMALAFLIVFTYQGAFLAVRATDRSPILEITRIYFYVIMPVAGATMVGYTIRDLWKLIGKP